MILLFKSWKGIKASTQNLGVTFSRGGVIKSSNMIHFFIIIIVKESFTFMILSVERVISFIEIRWIIVYILSFFWKVMCILSLSKMFGFYRRVSYPHISFVNIFKGIITLDRVYSIVWLIKIYLRFIIFCCMTPHSFSPSNLTICSKHFYAFFRNKLRFLWKNSTILILYSIRIPCIRFFLWLIQ